MPGLKIIEIVLGLTFVYLLMSLLCTAVNEYISGMLNKRGKELFKAIDVMLQSDAVRTAFRNHPLISTLSSSKRLPSYIPARNFALALLNSIDYTPDPAGSPPASPPDSTTVATPPKLKRLLDALRLESTIDVSPLLQDPAVATILSSAVPETVIDTLTQAVTGAERDLQKLQNAVEVWFNNQMDRVSGAYKRYTQIALLLIGFVAAALLNVDTIRIWQTLATNDQLRESLVQRAIAFDSTLNRAVTTDTTQVAASTDTTQASRPRADSSGTAPNPSASGTVQSSATGASADNTCTPVTGDAAQKALAKALSKQQLTCSEVKAVMAITRAELDSTQLALGWSRAELLAIGVAKEVPNDSAKGDSTRADTTKARSGAGATGSTAQGSARPAAAGTHLEPSVPDSRAEWLAFLVKLVGLILTAIAVSLGAPFWFDMLNKIINIRAAGRAPDERPKNPEARDKRLAGQAPR